MNHADLKIAKYMVELREDPSLAVFPPRTPKIYRICYSPWLAIGNPPFPAITDLSRHEENASVRLRHTDRHTRTHTHTQIRRRIGHWGLVLSRDLLEKHGENIENYTIRRTPAGISNPKLIPLTAIV